MPCRGNRHARCLGLSPHKRFLFDARPQPEADSHTRDGHGVFPASPPFVIRLRLTRLRRQAYPLRSFFGLRLHRRTLRAGVGGPGAELNRTAAGPEGIHPDRQGRRPVAHPDARESPCGTGGTSPRLPPPRNTSVALRLRLEELETREVPAVLIQVDYSLDNGFFSNNPAARAVMEQVASELGNSLSGNLSAITPGGGNTWTATFFNPATGADGDDPNMTIGAGSDQGVRRQPALGGGEAGFAGTSGYSVSGTPDWVNLSESGRGPRRGAEASPSTPPGTGTSARPPPGSPRQQTRLLLGGLCTRLGHVLGIGHCRATWNSLSSGGYFPGATRCLSTAGRCRWPRTAITGPTASRSTAAVSLDPILMAGTRVSWSSLDAAALRDLGWGAGCRGLRSARAPEGVVSAGGQLSGR